MDSSLKIRNNSIYKNKKSYGSAYKRGKKKWNNYIKDKTDELINELPIFVFIDKIFNRKGLYLACSDLKILVCLSDKTTKMDTTLQNKCSKFGITLFHHYLKDDPIDLRKRIEEFLSKYPKWLETRAKQLNKNLPKSEKWFRDRFEKEEFFKDLEIEYNKPFKRFIYDAISLKKQIAIEVDGSIHDEKTVKIRDEEKNKLTGCYGLKMIRVKAYDDLSYNNAMLEIKKWMNKKLDKKTIQNFEWASVTPKKNPSVILRKKIDSV